MDDFGDVPLRVAVSLDKLPVTLGFFEGIEVEPLDVLNERELRDR